MFNLPSRFVVRTAPFAWRKNRSVTLLSYKSSTRSRFLFVLDFRNTFNIIDYTIWTQRVSRPGPSAGLRSKQKRETEMKTMKQSLSWADFFKKAAVIVTFVAMLAMIGCASYDFAETFKARTEKRWGKPYAQWTQQERWAYSVVVLQHYRDEHELAVARASAPQIKVQPNIYVAPYPYY
jgi:hypothetical protein